MIDIESIKERLATAKETHSEAAANYRTDTDDALAWENCWAAARVVANIEHELKTAISENNKEAEAKAAAKEGVKKNESES